MFGLDHHGHSHAHGKGDDHHHHGHSHGSDDKDSLYHNGSVSSIFTICLLLCLSQLSERTVHCDSSMMQMNGRYSCTSWWTASPQLSYWPLDLLWAMLAPRVGSSMLTLWRVCSLWWSSLLPRCHWSVYLIFLLLLFVCKCLSYFLYVIGQVLCQDYAASISTESQC
jgi:hypothetical protein